jgi:hypothetical protein
MVQLAALAVQQPTFDPMRATLAGAQLFGSQIQNATSALQLNQAQQQHQALTDFAARGGFGNPQSLQSLIGQPQMFSGALQGFTQYQQWRNTQNALAAQRVLAAGADGSDARSQAWRQELEQALAQQRIDQNTYAQFLAQQPSDMVLQRLIDMARPPGAEMTLSEVMRMGMPGGPGGGQPPPGAPRPVDPLLSYYGQQGRDRIGVGEPSPDVAENLRELERLGFVSGVTPPPRPPASRLLAQGADYVGTPYMRPDEAPPVAPPVMGGPRRGDMLVPPLTPLPVEAPAPMPPSPRGRAGMLVPPLSPTAPPPVAAPQPPVAVAPPVSGAPLGASRFPSVEDLRRLDPSAPMSVAPPPAPTPGTAMGALPPPGAGAPPIAPPAPPSVGSGQKGSPGNPYTMAEMQAIGRQTGEWPEGAHVSYNGRVYRVRGGELEPVESSAASDPTRVYSWLGTAEAQTPPPGGGQPPPGAQSIPGITVSPQGASTFATPSWAPGGGGPQLGGDAQPGAPEAGGGQETIGQVIQRVMGSASAAQRARFWTLMARASTRDDAMKLLQEIESGGAPLTARQRAESEEGLRREFTTMARPYFDMRDAFSRLQASTENPSPAGDIALIFNFMKMLDPGSVVREGEFATAQNAGGVPDRILNLYNRILSGQRLNADQRVDFVDQARRLLTSQQRQYQAIQRQYGSVAQRMGLNTDNVLIDFTAPPTPLSAAQQQLVAEARQAIESGAPPDAVRRRLEQRGIDPTVLDR